MCGSLFLSAGKLFYPQQRVKPFRRSGGLPPQARLALLGRGLFAMTWRGECRRLAAETRGDVGHLRFPMSPLDTPLTFHWPLSEAFAAKRGLRGLGSVRRAGFGTLLGPEFALRDLQRCQCAARRCRAFVLFCEKLRFHQVLYLEAPDVPVGPSLLDARPQGVAA